MNYKFEDGHYKPILICCVCSATLTAEDNVIFLASNDELSKGFSGELLFVCHNFRQGQKNVNRCHDRIDAHYGRSLPWDNLWNFPVWMGISLGCLATPDARATQKKIAARRHKIPTVKRHRLPPIRPVKVDRLALEKAKTLSVIDSIGRPRRKPA